MRRLRLRLVGPTVVLAVVLAGCSTTGSGNGSAGAATLTIAISKQVGNLDPYKFDALWHAQALIFEPLVRYGDGGKIEPALAESWAISPDGRGYTFALRQGVTFTDGTPWNAQAAVAGLKHWVGNPRFDFLGASSAIKDITTDGEHTVKLHLDKPYAGLLQELTITRPVRFLSPRAANPDGTMKDAVGTGPFTVESNTSTETVLRRNDAYWGERPAVARVALKVIPDAQARITALRAGTIDVTGGDFAAPLSPQDAQTLGTQAQVKTAPGNTTILLAFNDDPGRVAADPAVRQAVNLAVDRKGIVDGIFAGLGTPAGSLFPDTVPNSQARQPIARDIERARSTLEAAGWTGSPTRSKAGRPLELGLVVSNERLPGARAFGEAVQAELAEAGIAVRIDDVDHATAHDRIPARDYDIALFTTYGAPYDPGNTLNGLVLSTVDSGPDGKIYKNTELDPLITAAVQANEPNLKSAAYQRVYSFLDDKHALAPIMVPARVWAFGRRVQDVSLPPTEYEFPIAGIRVDGS